MKRPAFQFYTGDWQKNAKLRRCSPAARGVWIDILCLMHDSDEYGVLRWPLKDIANAAGASMALVRELVAKGVLKGADKDAEPYVYRAKHAGKEGDPVALVLPDGGPIWYSSRFVRDEWVRQKRGGSTRFDTDNQPDSRPPKVGLGERVGDGPSTSSSPSGSEANASAGAGAPPVDNSNPEPSKPDPARRAAWLGCGNWMVENGVAKSTAREVIGLVLKDYPATALEAMQAAAKAGSIADPRGWLVATAKRLAGERKTVPSDDAEKTAAALASQTLTEEQRAANAEAARAARERMKGATAA